MILNIMIMILVTISKEIQVSFGNKERILKQEGKKIEETG